LVVPKIGWLRTGYQGCIRATRRFLRSLRADLVHGQGTERDCGICAVFSGFPNVITIHGNMRELAQLLRPLPGSYLWCAAQLERFTLPRTNGVFCNSAYTEHAVRYITRQTWCVPNAIRREFFEVPFPVKSTKGVPRLLNVGVISPRKRQLEILALAEELYQEGAMFELQLIGVADKNDRYAASVLERIEVAQRAGFARYLGTLALPNLIAIFDKGSALIHAPAEEAFGLVVAEALARNLKIFGTSVGGIREIAAAVEGAELFSLDDWNGLKNSIRRWLDDGLQPTLAAAAMRKRYHPRLIAERHLEIYQEVLAIS